MRNVGLCRNTQQRKLNIQARMRGGYSSAEGEGLRVRLRDTERRLDRDCIGKVPQHLWIRGNAR